MQDPDRFYTLEEYWKLLETFPEHKYEYSDGVVRMMTGGSPAHAHIGANLVRLVGSALLDRDCIVYNSDAVVELFESTCYCPDLTVSCDPADWTREKSLESPTVVVEVLSPRTEKTDRLEKLEMYRRYPTIQEILLVDSRRCYVEHHHRAIAPRWDVFIYEREGDVVDLTSIDVSLAVRDIYFKVHLVLEG